MVSKIISATFLFSLVAFNSIPSFAYDAELAESSKCSRYFAMYEEAFHMPSNLIRAIAVTESGKYVKGAGKAPWPWTINVEGKSYYYANKREAIRAVSGFQAKGIKSIDVGCMQVNLMYHPEAFRNLEQAFEPKYNIGYASQFLRDKFMQAGNWQGAVGLYHNGNPEINKDYIKQVYSVWRQEDRLVQVASGKMEIEVSDAPQAAPDTASNADVSAISRSVLSRFAR